MHVATRPHGARGADDFLVNGCMCRLPSASWRDRIHVDILCKQDRRRGYSGCVIRGHPRALVRLERATVPDQRQRADADASRLSVRRRNAKRGGTPESGEWRPRASGRRACADEPQHLPVRLLAGPSLRHAFRVTNLLQSMTRKTPGYGDRIPRVKVVAQRETARVDIASYYDISRQIQCHDLSTTDRPGSRLLQTYWGIPYVSQTFDRVIQCLENLATPPKSVQHVTAAG